MSFHFDNRNLRKLLRAFFMPQITRLYLLRVILLALSAFCFFRFLFQPMIIQGGSMLPTYPSSGFLFCRRSAFWFSEPERGDVVIMRYGKGAMLLKRVIGKEGDRIAFRNGVLFRNGVAVKEPYLAGSCDWELPERVVRKDHYYLAGDNRSMPMNRHVFGEMHKRYLQGAPLW